MNASDDGGVRFIALLSLLCKHYGWDHDFWRRMGRNEFYAWVTQLHDERLAENQQGDSWQATENDPAWQAMRDKRKRRQGR